MWRSRLYSDVRIVLTGNFGGNHESTTAIFSSHRFTLVSRSSYFHTALISWPSPKYAATNTGEPPMLSLPSPPLLLHRCISPIYTSTLIFSHRTYDLSTAFAILRSALYLSSQLSTTRFNPYRARNAVPCLYLLRRIQTSHRRKTFHFSLRRNTRSLNWPTPSNRGRTPFRI